MMMAQLGNDPVRSNGRIDDLTRIHGIGPAIEKRLHQGGILTYTQLAALTPAEAAQVVGEMIGMSPVRVLEQEWIEQASQLAQEAQAERGLGDSPEPGDGWRYAVFSLELLLDDQNRVRKTRALHVQSRADLSWRGWDAARLQEFITDKAGVAIAPESAAQEVEHELQPLMAVEAGAPNPTPGNPVLVGSFQLTGMKLNRKDALHLPMTLKAHQPFNLKVDLDLTQLEFEPQQRLAYRTLIYARGYGPAQQHLVAQSQGWFQPANQVSLELSDLRLNQGKYRLQVFIQLSSSEAGDYAAENPAAILESAIIEVS